MDRHRFEEIVRTFTGRRLVVIGDLMTDEYLWGRATRISPESPVMVVEVERETSVPGGAANVVNNLLALGAEVAVVGVVGEDAAGAQLKRALIDEGADVTGVVVDASRPTTRKTRVVAQSQQVLRVDREQTHPIDGSVAGALIERFEAELAGADAVVVSDYAKGVLTHEVCGRLVEISRRAGVAITANAKPQNARAMAGADLIQLNRQEATATAALGSHGRRLPRFDADDEVEQAGRDLRRELDIGTLLVTRGAKGLMLWQRDGSILQVPAHVVEVYDEAGAGDTVISALTLSLAARASVVEAAEVANYAAALVVRKVGVATVTAEELLGDGLEPHSWP